MIEVGTAVDATGKFFVAVRDEHGTALFGPCRDYEHAVAEAGKIRDIIAKRMGEVEGEVS